jgi:hypothetical protein
MAIRTFNSVGGYSVGETPETIILANGDITTDFGTFTANVSAGNLLTDNLLYANGVPWDFLTAGGTNTQVQFNDNNDFGGSANFTFDKTTYTLSVTNANVANINANGTVNFTSASNVTLGPITNVHIGGGSAGAVLQTDGSGTLTWASAGSTGISGQNTWIQYNNAGAFGSDANFTYNQTTDTLGVKNVTMESTGSLSGGNLLSATYLTGTLTTAAQPNITSVGTLTSLAVTGNVSANYFIGNGSQLTDLNGANISNVANANYANFAGTVITAAQPNITSVGTLTSLTVTNNANSGNIYTGNLSLTGQVITHMIPGNDNTYDLGNSSYEWRNAYISSNIFIGGSGAYLNAVGEVIHSNAMYIDNNLSTGSLTSRGDATLQGNATISGNLTVSGTTTFINVTELDVKDPLISLGGSTNGANATTYDGKDRGLWLRNYKSDDSGPVNMFMGWDTGNGEFALGSNVSVSSDVVTFNSFGNIRGDAFIGNLSGQVLTATQTGITTVGTLTNLTIAGNLQVNATANINSLIASGLSYPTSDGTSGQVLQTNGSGTLSWGTISTSSITNGTSNVNVVNNGNVNISSGGVANVLTVTSTGANISGTLNVTGNVVADNTTVTKLIIGTTQIGQTVATTTSIGSQPIANVAKSGVTGLEFFVKGIDSTGSKYTIATVQAVTDGTDVDWDVFGGISLGGTNPAGGTFSVAISGSNIQLSVNPSSSNSTVWTTQYRTI